MASCDPKDLIKTAACFDGIPPVTLQGINTVLLCKILLQSQPMSSCDPKTLAQAAACFSGIPLKSLIEIQTQLLCEILNGGGTGGPSCLLCGSVDPTAAPACDCAIYYNRTSAAFWYWDSVAVKWFAFIQ